MIMEPIIDPVDVALIEAELTPDKKLGDTNKGGNELYVVTWQDSPNTVKEIGRLREISYREAGASSGKSMDIDEYDTMDNPYHQLIVWLLQHHSSKASILWHSAFGQFFTGHLAILGHFLVQIVEWR